MWRQFWWGRRRRDRRGGATVEGALIAWISTVVILGVLDIGLAILAAQGVQRSADVAVSAFAVGMAEDVVRQRSVEAAPGFLRGCLTVSAQGWSSVTAADFGSVGGQVESGTKIVRVDVSCTWAWLSPGVRLVAGPSATFRALGGAVLP